MAAGHFRILSKDNALPLVAFSLTNTVDKDGKEEARQYTEFDLADKLRQRGWVLPAYTMAPDARQVHQLPLLLCEHRLYRRGRQIWYTRHQMWQSTWTWLIS